MTGRLQFLNFELFFSKYFSQFNAKQDMFYLQFSNCINYKVLYKSYFFIPAWIFNWKMASEKNTQKQDL